MTQPNPLNFCGGNFFDWLEVYLTSECNGRCKWCIDRNSYRPSLKASVEDMIQAIKKTGKKNVILLGGEPTLYKEIRRLIEGVKPYCKIYITTNGSLLTTDYILDNLYSVTGINISIHHYDLIKNKEITGLSLDLNTLVKAINTCISLGISVRLNCNIIKNYIDSEMEILEYLAWVKDIGVTRVRFAELKGDLKQFIDLAEILNHSYGLNDNPFVFGCNKDAKILGVNVGFRQMCGLQTELRCRPDNPQCEQNKKVLYYDGKIYDGWMIKGDNMTEGEKQELAEIKKTIESLQKRRAEIEGKTEPKIPDSGFCHY